MDRGSLVAFVVGVLVGVLGAKKGINTAVLLAAVAVLTFVGMTVEGAELALMFGVGLSVGVLVAQIFPELAI